MDSEDEYASEQTGKIAEEPCTQKEYKYSIMGQLVSSTSPFLLKAMSQSLLSLLVKMARGKSILLSHIVNGLMAAKGVAYSRSPEIETGMVYKLRSGIYIKSGNEYYFARVDFEEHLFMGEIMSGHKKRHYVDYPIGLLRR